MADDEKEKEEGAEEEEEKKSDGGGLGDDFMDLFEEAGEVVDESLALLTASLVDIPIDSLMEQIQDIRSIVEEIRDR